MPMWKKIKGFNNYEVSSDGVIRNIKTKRNLKYWYHNAGYYMVDLCENGKRKKLLVHRIVAETFIPNPENKDCINHKDGNKTNNSLNNLEWCSKGENNIHAIEKLGKLKKKVKCVNDGIVYESLTEASSKTGISISYISANLNGRSEYAKGLRFIFV
jgi:HNH endonuclease/NUMOD4 motif